MCPLHEDEPDGTTMPFVRNQHMYAVGRGKVPEPMPMQRRRSGHLGRRTGVESRRDTALLRRWRTRLEEVHAGEQSLPMPPLDRSADREVVDRAVEQLSSCHDLALPRE